MDEPSVPLHDDGVGAAGRRDGAGGTDLLPAEPKNKSPVTGGELLGNSDGKVLLYQS